MNDYDRLQNLSNVVSKMIAILHAIDEGEVAIAGTERTKTFDANDITDLTSDFVDLKEDAEEILGELELGAS